ncbi:extracellular solute-binding protein [Paenibacillus sacheonensis]|uniref:Extracellular solute-binding protein n=1 Tax=Paenibacillus sacheonensis TaxID=742054 RepID=A0A7X4YTS6_9BACL|nr:extracellular solute-binding protein [Paenibacillus sacheonensis]MBM7568680.1 multiple sugar transport system substrate-binding protein [Paenibacillus sacheonensis]NBC72428.1 extracellular solute-binding protein [Paenibacillus sacheonensis]
MLQTSAKLPIFAAAALLALPVLLASCSGEDGGQAPPPPEKRSLIRFVASEYSTETKPILEKLVKEFELKNPLIDIELQVANWDILDGIYTTMISQNQPPDLLNTNVYAHFAADGLLNDFNDILSPELRNKLYPNLMSMDQIEGHQYAIPYVATIRNLYYNRDLFDRAGIRETPATWSELKADAVKIKKSGGEYGFGVDLTDNETQAYLSYFFFGAGGGWIKNGKWTINSPENVEGLTYMKTLFDAGLTDPEPTITTRDEKQRILGDGKLGMMISGNYFTSVVPKEFPNLKWGVGEIPVKDGTAPISFGVHDVLVSFKTDHTDKVALSKFLDFLYDNPSYMEMIQREGFLPANAEVGAELAAEDDGMKANLLALTRAKFYPVQEPAWQAVMDYARKLGDAVLFDRLTPQAALDELQHFAETRSKQQRAQKK